MLYPTGDMNGTNDRFDNWTLDGFYIICGDANSPDAPNRAGGGMYIRLSSTSARARVANCAFGGNKSAYGGGLCIINSSPTITDTLLWNNESSFRGGGLYVYAGSPSIENCSFSYNTAASYGGAMYTRYSGANISNSTFFQNSTGESGKGGGLFTYNRSDKLSTAVDGCEFIDNSAKTGGGVYNFTYQSTTSPVFTNCTFEANEASSTGDGGGGMYNYDYDSNIAPRLINCLFYRNNAINNKGGAIYNYKRAGDTTASPIITNSTFAFNYSQYSPGGVRNWRSSVEAINNVFWGNDFVGILDGNVSDSTLKYCALQQEWTGSGVNNIFGQDPLFDDPIQDDFRITESSPCKNAGTDASAPDSDIVQYPRDEEPDIGAYEYQGKCVFYVSTQGNDSNSGFSWQDAFATVQKGIDAAQEASVDTDPCEVWVKEGTYYIFKGNKTDTVRLQPLVFFYGGFAGNETSLVQRNLRMYQTILDGSDGNLEDDHRVYHVVTGSDESGIDGFIIKNGRANGTDNNRRGAGMFNNESSPDVSNCIFIDNKADSYGGGIYCLDSYPTIKNCLFSRNLGSYGGGIYVRNSLTSTVEVMNCTFSENEALYGNAGLRSYHSDVNITNSIIWNNRVINVTDYRIEIGHSGTVPDINYCDVKDGTGYGPWDDGTGNINEDPKFINPGELNFRIPNGSPCKNSGNTSPAPPLDIELNPKWNDRDIGAYEFQRYL